MNMHRSLISHIAHAQREVVVPVSITRKNALELTGETWRWWLESGAPSLGLRVITVGGKRMILVAELVEALRKQAATDVAPAEAEQLDEVESVRAALGLRVVGGSR